MPGQVTMLEDKGCVQVSIPDDDNPNLEVHWKEHVRMMRRYGQITDPVALINGTRPGCNIETLGSLSWGSVHDDGGCYEDYEQHTTAWNVNVDGLSDDCTVVLDNSE